MTLIVEKRKKRLKNLGFSVFAGAHAYMLLEVLAEERLVGEVHLLGNILDAERGVLQNDAQLERHVVVYPLVGRALANLLHHF